MATKSLQALRPIILIFLITIIGVAFIVSNANTISPVISSQKVSNESINRAAVYIAPLPTVNTSKQLQVTRNPNTNSNLSLAYLTITNASGSAATVTTDYVVNLTDGTFTLKNTSIWTQNLNNNITLVTYAYYDKSYSRNNGANSIFGLIDFITALGILLAAVGYLYKSEIFEYLGR